MRQRSPFPIVILTAVSLLFSSCASTGPSVSREELKRKQEEFQLKFHKASERWLPRVYRVGYPLVSSPVPGHKSEEKKYNFVGVGVEELKDHGRKVYGIDKKVKGVLVRGIYEGSKAEGMDLQPGDVIAKVDAKEVKNLGAYFGRIRKTKKETVTAEIVRKGRKLEHLLPVEKVYYNAQFFLAPTPNFEASSAFSKIEVGIGAIRYCRNDDELAVIMGHELAHTTLRHSIKKVGAGTASALAYGAVAAVIDAATVGGVGNLVMSPVQKATDAAVSRRYEREADYYGLQHAFHSGYSIQHGSKIFARLATDAPGFEILAYTFASHPKSPERFLRLEKAAEEMHSRYPDKIPKPRPDWAVTVPVKPGETLEEALVRLQAKAGKKKSVVSSSEKGTATSANPDTTPPSAYPAPKT